MRTLWFRIPMLKDPKQFCCLNKKNQLCFDVFDKLDYVTKQYVSQSCGLCAYLSSLE